MTSRRPAPAALALALAALVGAACSGGGDGGNEPAGGDPGTDPPATGARVGACGLVTADEVGDLFGLPAEATPPEGPPVTCLWEARDDAGMPTHQLQVSIYEGPEAVDPAAYGQGARPVEGVGDEAFVVAGGFLGTTAAARQGEASVVLTYAVLAGEGAGAGPEQADEVVALLRSAAERLDD